MSAQLEKTIKIQGLIKGLILGAVLAVVSIIYFYFMVNVASAVAITVGAILFTYIIPIAIAAFFCINLRSKVGGYWTMRQAATGIFIMFFISNLTIFILRDQVFANAIEPQMAQKTKTAMVTALNKLKESTAKPEEKKEADAKIKEMEKNFQSGKNITIGQQIQSMGITIIFLFVLSIIFAAFFKRDPVGHTS
ncbi:DUF4199 domain-containing protein [Mucilaginibacter sp. Mucisp84]|uniref:DUF4199 domain-containing protein n=1 Tax=Mucilaginibacter sp. Mucisp84 TaxID=3243058 RepID=UPI0039A4D3E7